MAQHGSYSLFFSLVLGACCLQACADGMQERDDVNRPRDNPLPALELTSSDPGRQEPAWLPLGSHPIAFHETPAWLPLGSHPLASHEASADAGPPADDGDAATADAGDAAPDGGTQ
jgi:hypothetical protein